MARLTIRVTEQELHEIQRLARLREVTPSQLCHQAITRILEIEAKNPRAALSHPDDDDEIPPAKLQQGFASNLSLRSGVADPLDIIRRSTDPGYTARVEALAAVLHHDEDSLFVIHAQALLTGLFTALAFNSGFTRPATIHDVRELLTLEGERFAERLRQLQSDKSIPTFVYWRLTKCSFRTDYEMETIRIFTLAALDSFFEPVLTVPPLIRSAPQHSQQLIVMIPLEEHKAFVMLASRLRTSPNVLGREAIQRLVGQNRPHLALVSADYGKD